MGVPGQNWRAFHRSSSEVDVDKALVGKKNYKNVKGM
jgi:hypothetical protein